MGCASGELGRWDPDPRDENITLNPILRGWVNSFAVGHSRVRKCYLHLGFPQVEQILIRSEQPGPRTRLQRAKTLSLLILP